MYTYPVRCQCLWRDIVSQEHFNMMDAVDKYGYTDLPHLMREFERYHSMSIRNAREMALRYKLKLPHFTCGNPTQKGNSC